MQRVLVYEGPFGPMVKMLKRVSIFSCGCTLVGVPLLATFGNPEMSSVQRASIAFTVCAFAVGTTVALTYVSKPYIWRLYEVQAAANAKKSLEIESFSILGKLKTTRLAAGIEEVKPATDRVFVNVALKDGSTFYVHEEPDCYATDDFYVQFLKAAGIVPGATSK
ncbi:Hypothetical Protein FCC1311_057492 [Hondaea fermentalgiana]|uniref:Uncharacterized protein n=1 Tax=Hondaea fermentalgiana TaxID=2315210 RepID=A0A2R5GIH3_9STRA|nr:Hypothetical Protein FCC1311_057492 [Hondaea fermentalgiana]|eukprot:GBG29528.1 Hypothetical Protein FCC1311_057492 [Hondaea fermentalgiana]